MVNYKLVHVLYLYLKKEKRKATIIGEYLGGKNEKHEILLEKLREGLVHL